MTTSKRPGRKQILVAIIMLVVDVIVIILSWLLITNEP